MDGRAVPSGHRGSVGSGRGGALASVGRHENPSVVERVLGRAIPCRNDQDGYVAPLEDPFRDAAEEEAFRGP